MPETTLHPPNQPRADTVVAQPVLTEYQGLRALGWLQPIDFVVMFCIGMAWMTLLFWKIFGNPSPWNILTCALIAGGFTQLWAILLIFRTAHFVLLIQAYLNNLPEEAARIVMAAYSGAQRTSTPKSTR